MFCSPAQQLNYIGLHNSSACVGRPIRKLTLELSLSLHKLTHFQRISRMRISRAHNFLCPFMDAHIIFCLMRQGFLFEKKLAKYSNRNRLVRLMDLTANWKTNKATTHSTMINGFQFNATWEFFAKSAHLNTFKRHCTFQSN